MDDASKCDKTYVPTTDQYMTALGSFGSSIVIIGSLVTLALFVLFLEQLLYTNQTAHSTCKRHIYWIASVFPIMTMMSVIGLLIPRAHNVCVSVKMVYMSIGISHFTDLTMVMFGGEEQLVERGLEDTFNMRLSPVCCCCKCLPYPPVTKYSLRLVVLLTDQLPFIQAIYYVLVMILLSADNITLGDVNPAGAYLWLNIVKFASVLFGVYGFMILSNFSRRHLHGFQYGKKSKAIYFLVLVSNFQSLIFNIMGYYDAFPCIPPYISPSVYRQTVDNSLYILEMMILGPYTYWQYHDLQFGSPLTPVAEDNSSHTSSSIISSNDSQGEYSIRTSTAMTDNSSGGSGDTRDTHSHSNRTTSINEVKGKENGAVNGDCEKGDSIITTQVSGSVAGPASTSKRSRSTRSSSRRHSRDDSSTRARSSVRTKTESTRKKAKSTKTKSKHDTKKTATTFYDLNEILETEKTTSSAIETTTAPEKDDTSNIDSNTTKTNTSVSLCPGVLNKAMSLSQPNMKTRNEYERLH